MLIRNQFCFLLCLSTVMGAAQVGGRVAFPFLNHSVSARITALGGEVIAVRDNDPALGFRNPAMLNDSMHRNISFSHEFLLGGVQSGFAGAVWHVSKWKTTFLSGVQYLNYGIMQGNDPFGNATESFSAAETAFNIGAGHQINERFSIGMNVKYIRSQLETYQSTGLATDLAGAYYDATSRFGFTVVARNLGVQLSSYNDIKNSLPLDIQIGISKKLSRAPFRFSLIAHDLQQWNLRDEAKAAAETNILGETPATTQAWVQNTDNFFRHLIFNAELLMGKSENFRLRFGYNHQRRKEMMVPNLLSYGGFSFGVGLKINRFRLDYGRGNFHLAGGSNHLTLSTHL
jgi:hypothetical protein